MALTNLEKALATALGLEIYKPGTTKLLSKKAVQAAFVLAVKGGQITGRAALPLAARALPPVARAIANPYVGIPLGVAGAGYATQQYLDESGTQEEINVATDQALAFIREEGPKRSRRVKSAYNRAVSKAMKAVKASTKGGPMVLFQTPKRLLEQYLKR